MTAVPFPIMRSEQLAATAGFILRFYFFKTRQCPSLHAAALGCYTLNTFHTL